MNGASGKVVGQGAGDRIRQPLSIEQLLIWAYADQMVHQATQTPRGLGVKSKGPLAAYSTLWSEGVTPIDSSARQGFSASDDAWRIHDQVMKLGKITVDCGQDLAASRYHALGQYRGAEPPLGCVGNRDAGMRGPATARPWPTDGMLDIDVRTLVALHASKATRPSLPTRPVWRLKPVHKGMVQSKSRSGAYRLGWYQHLEIDGVTPGEMAETSALYRAWWDALNLLRKQIAGLTMFSVTEEMPRKV